MKCPYWCIIVLYKSIFLCFVDRASRYNRAKKNQLDAQFILSIFRQPLHVSGVSMAHHQVVTHYVYNNWYLLFLLDDCLLSWLDCSNPTRTTDSHLTRIIRTNFCIHTVVPPDDGP